MHFNPFNNLFLTTPPFSSIHALTGKFTLDPTPAAGKSPVNSGFILYPFIGGCLRVPRAFRGGCEGLPRAFRGPCEGVDRGFRGLNLTEPPRKPLATPSEV